MKKIAFFVQWMLCGGVENALIALANVLVDKGNDVTIYVIEKKGEFIKRIPVTVKLKTIPMNSKIRKNIPVGGQKLLLESALKNKNI